MDTASHVRSTVGQTLVSKWLDLDQRIVDRFADVTGDHQFIHVDPARAENTPFGSTIVHGFLLLSLLPMLRASAVEPAVAGPGVRINYGFDRVRFVSPVRTGSRIRATFTVVEVEEKEPGRFQTATNVAIEVEGQEKPAVVARWIGQILISQS